MADDWRFVPSEPLGNITSSFTSAESQGARKKRVVGRRDGASLKTEHGANEEILAKLERLDEFLERNEERYLLISGQLDALGIALEEHKIGPWADPQGYIINRVVKPDHRLAQDLDPQTQLKLLAWLYRLHDPRVEKTAAVERAIRTMNGEGF